MTYSATSETSPLTSPEDSLKIVPEPYVHAWHYDMLINRERSEFYKTLILERCQGKVVLEIGTGAGLLAVLAIKNGAKKVICCEENPYLAKAAGDLFQRLGMSEHILLIPKNSKDIATSEIEPVDIILHELFGSDPFNEEMVPTLKDARRFMKPEGIFVPEKIQIVYQPVTQSELQEPLIFDGIEMKEMAALLSSIHPSLRKRAISDSALKAFTLPEVTVTELLEKPYVYDEKNKALVDVDTIEVSFFIIDGPHRFQAAKFEDTQGRIHWFSLYFYKLDTQSDQIRFFVKNENQLLVL